MGKSGRARWLLRAGAITVVLAVTSSASADRGTGLDGSLSALALWMPYVPTLAVPLTETPVRTIQGGTLPPSGPLYFGGVAVDSSFVHRGHLVIPLLGVSGALAVGQSDAVTSSLDGSLAEERPWTAFRFEFLLPGLGVRATVRRWSVSATLRPYVVGILMDATVATAGGSSDLSTPSRVGLGLRGDLEGCRRLDPLNRFCVFVAPTVYDFGSLNGGSAGVRWEVGP
jgi:hypothetical protein